jgi:hypothetical protein
MSCKVAAMLITGLGQETLVLFTNKLQILYLNKKLYLKNKNKPTFSVETKKTAFSNILYKL